MTDEQKVLCFELLVSYNKIGFNSQQFYFRKNKELQLQNKHLKEQITELIEQNEELNDFLCDLMKEDKK
jgi:cell shape-determining protein MreC